MTKAEKIKQLKEIFDGSENVWFLVDVKYRVVAFNKKAEENSLAFHNKPIVAGESMLDYARDTKNEVDAEFIRCLGKAATGLQVEHQQKIVYNSATISSKSVYTPVYNEKNLVGISILVQYTLENPAGPGVRS